MRIGVDEPCAEVWDDMAPRAEGRYCARCDQVVVDLSRATRREVERLLRRGGPVCAQIRADDEGDAIFEPERVVPAARLLRAAVLASALGGCASAAEPAPAVIEAVEEAEDAATPLAIPTTGFGGSLLGPGDAPMIPIGALPPRSCPLPPSDDVEGASPEEPTAGAVLPTAEQRALTRRKARERAIRHHAVRGRIISRP